LSQPSSQLSSSKQSDTKDESNGLKQSTTTMSKKRATATSTVVTSKKTKIDVVHVSDENLPKYLSKEMHSFDEKLNSLSSIQIANVDIERLRQIAYIIHSINLYTLNQSLWTTYLRSGTGAMKVSTSVGSATDNDSEKDRNMITENIRSEFELLWWPDEVKTSMIANQYTTLSSNEIDHITCLNYVRDKIREFGDLNASYYEQLEEQKKQLDSTFTTQMESTIKEFVETNGTSIHRIPIEGEMASVEFKYRDKLFELEFQQQKPHPYQVNIIVRPSHPTCLIRSIV
jgi:hypothetical protein